MAGKFVAGLLAWAVAGGLVPLRADEAAAAPPKPFVILVGAGEFKDPQVKARESAVADATRFYDLLTDPKILGADKDHIKLLLSTPDEKRGSTEATKSNVLQAFTDVAERAGKDDPVYVVIVGSGAALGERTCLFLDDSTFADRGKNALFATEIETAFAKLKSQKLTVFLDINLKGFNVPNEKITANIMDMVRAFLGLKDKEDQNLPEAKLVFLANDGSSTLNVDKQGIFAKVAGDAIEGAADTEGNEPDGNITVDEFVKYCEKEIPNLARKVGKNNEEKLQAPFAITSRSNHGILTHNRAEYPKAQERLAKLDALAKDNKVTKELYEEGHKYLERMPKLKTPQELRKTFQKFVDGAITLDELTKTRQKLTEGMVLDPNVATDFSRRVLGALTMVQDSYIKDLKLTELVASAVKGLYLRADEKVTPELQKRVDAVKDLTRADLGKILAEARLALGKREDLDDNHDVEWTLQVVLSRLESFPGKIDRYSEYVEKDEVERLKRDLGNEFTGIGVIIRRELVRDGLMVVTPIRGSPAYKAGIKSGDLITKIVRPVDQEGKPISPPEEKTTQGMKTDDAVKLIVGKAGTDVTIFVEREDDKGAKTEIPFELKRGRVEVESVLGYKRNNDDSWDYYIDKDSKIAYIHLTQFSRRSDEIIKATVTKLKDAGLKGLIFDVRENPGGFLPVVSKICDMFIEDGLIVEIRPRVGDKEVYRKRGSSTFIDFPMVVLTNGHSASASEIMAACLQDHSRAIVMGERSYGKGSVQTIQEYLPTGGEIKMTIATFWRPSGKNLNKSSTTGKEEEDWGVRPNPDYLIKLPLEEQIDVETRLREWMNIPRRDIAPKEPAKPFKDRQLDTALDYLRSQIKLGAKTSFE